MTDKLATIINLFEGKEIRSIWNAEKARLTNEDSELYTNCVRLKMKASDGKMRQTDTLDIEGILMNKNML